METWTEETSLGFRNILAFPSFIFFMILLFDGSLIGNRKLVLKLFQFFELYFILKLVFCLHSKLPT